MTPTSTDDDAWAAWAARGSAVADAETDADADAETDTDADAETDTETDTDAGAVGTSEPGGPWLRAWRREGRRSPRAGGGAVSPEVRFRRTLVALVSALALLCAGFVVVSSSQGPKLDEFQVDTTAVTQDPGQQARLFVGGAVSHVTASQVSVTPATRFTVQTIGTVIAVQFDDRLAYSTSYRIRVGRVTSVDGSRPSTLAARFTTVSPTVLSLVRPTSGADEIVRAHLRSPGRAVVYRAAGIQAFGVVGADLVVVTESSGLSTISLVALSDGTTEKLLLPSAGRVTGFAVDPPTGAVVFGFVAAGAGEARSNRSPSATPLYTIALSGNHLATPLLGPRHRPVSASAWFMEEGAPVVYARIPGGRVVRVDLSLGGTATITRAPAPGVAARLDGVSGVALPGGRTARIDGGLVVVGAPGRAPRVLYTPVSGTRVVDVQASPNGQFVAVVTAPATATSDSPSIGAAPPGATTLVIDAASGAQVASFLGADLDW